MGIHRRRLRITAMRAEPVHRPIERRQPRRPRLAQRRRLNLDRRPGNPDSRVVAQRMVDGIAKRQTLRQLDGRRTGNRSIVARKPNARVQHGRPRQQGIGQHIRHARCLGLAREQNQQCAMHPSAACEPAQDSSAHANSPGRAAAAAKARIRSPGAYRS